MPSPDYVVCGFCRETLYIGYSSAPRKKHECEGQKRFDALITPFVDSDYYTRWPTGPAGPEASDGPARASVAASPARCPPRP